MQLTGETNIVSLADKDNQWGRLVADDEYKQSLFSDSASGQLQEALRKLRSASVLISVTIKDELAGSNDQDVLERLYCAKGSVTCAIEETEKHFGG